MQIGSSSASSNAGFVQPVAPSGLTVTSAAVRLRLAPDVEHHAAVGQLDDHRLVRD